LFSVSLENKRNAAESSLPKAMAELIANAKNKHSIAPRAL
jgi:hypothetical protein